MDQRFVFASLALELVVAYWLFPVSLLTDAGDLLAQAKFSVFTAEISLGLTLASVVLIVVGLLRRRGRIPTHRRALIGLSCLAIPGILFWAWWANFALLVYPEGCDSYAPWKCYFVQAGTYLGYSFFPAIAIPLSRLSGHIESGLLLRSHNQHPIQVLFQRSSEDTRNHPKILP